MAGQREKQLEMVDFNSKQLLFEKPEKVSLPLLLLVQSWCMKEYNRRTKTQRGPGAASDKEGPRGRGGSVAKEKGSPHRNASCEMA